ncbi:MAG: DMT family transporter [Acidobacteria bacterium]|nr:DMT family transporter [Acidobacteriota bacterium]
MSSPLAAPDAGEVQAAAGPRRGKRGWLAWALASLLFFAATNFILGYIAEKSAADPAASVKAAMILWLGTGLLGGAATVGFRFSGRGFAGLAGRNPLLLPLAAGVSLALGMLLLKSGLAANPLAKGPIVAVASSSSLVVALLAWALLREKLSLGQWAGFLVIIAGIAMVSMGGGGRADRLALAFACLAMFLFGATNFMLKLAGTRGSDSLTAAVVLWLAVGGCGLLAIAGHRVFFSHFPLLASPRLSVLALLAGAFLALGMLGIKKAVTLGPAGPATAVSGSNAILVGVLDLALLGHGLPGLKLAGMLAAVAGIVVLALAKPLPRK